MVSTVIVGLGNPILTDDAVGPVVARLVHQRLNDASIELIEASVGGIALVEMLVGYDRAIIIDAIQTKDGQLGDCYLVDLEGSRISSRTGITHSIGLLEGLEVARMVGLQVPGELRVYAVEVSDPLTFSNEMTPAVQAAIPSVVDRILAEEFVIPTG